MKNIFITDKQLNKLDESISNSYDPRKVKIVVKYLDDGFKKGKMAYISNKGYAEDLPLVAMLGSDGSVLKNMTTEQLFYLLQDRFSKVFSEKSIRDEFLKDVIENWFHDGVTKDGILKIRRKKKLNEGYGYYGQRDFYTVGNKINKFREIWNDPTITPSDIHRVMQHFRFRPNEYHQYSNTAFSLVLMGDLCDDARNYYFNVIKRNKPQQPIAENKNDDFDFASVKKFRINADPLEYNHVTDAVNEAIDEFSGNVDLSSFNPQGELEPHIWKNGKMYPRIRMQLMDIAQAFIETLNVKWVKPKDVILTGSLANYNWSKFSDFDLHILMDFSDVDERTEFVKEYFDSKKKNWNDEHDELNIYGFPVEVYVQDINEKHTASGVYSLYKDKWIVEPDSDTFRSIHLNAPLIKKKVASIADKIDDLEKALKKEKDKQKIKIVSEKAKKLFTKIKGIRKSGLEKSGEMSTGNIIFKSLRRLDYLEKLSNLRTKAYDKMNSI